MFAYTLNLSKGIFSYIKKFVFDIFNISKIILIGTKETEEERKKRLVNIHSTEFESRENEVLFELSSNVNPPARPWNIPVRQSLSNNNYVDEGRLIHNAKAKINQEFNEDNLKEVLKIIADKLKFSFRNPSDVRSCFVGLITHINNQYSDFTNLKSFLINMRDRWRNLGNSNNLSSNNVNITPVTSYADNLRSDRSNEESKVSLIIKINNIISNISGFFKDANYNNSSLIPANKVVVNNRTGKFESQCSTRYFANLSEYIKKDYITKFYKMALEQFNELSNSLKKLKKSEITKDEFDRCVDNFEKTFSSRIMLNVLSNCKDDGQRNIIVIGEDSALYTLDELQSLIEQARVPLVQRESVRFEGDIYYYDRITRMKANYLNDPNKPIPGDLNILPKIKVPEDLEQQLQNLKNFVEKVYAKEQSNSNFR